MLNEYLNRLSWLWIDLIWNPKKISIKWNIFYVDSIVFWDQIPTDFIEYKGYFLSELDKKQNLLLDIYNELENDTLISDIDKNIIKNEILVRLKKVEFLSKIYDVEANKLDNKYKIIDKIEDYDLYNKLFYNVSKEDLDCNIEICENENMNVLFSKKDLESLLMKTHKYIPEFNYDFWEYMWLSCFKLLLRIPNNDFYNLRNIIAIFFHEMTHFFRYLNWTNNLWFSYFFEDYSSIEEWIALYNEYFYWNKICNYWKYSSFYDKCYQICLEDISEGEKKDKIYEILKNKWFDREKTDYYFYSRFYKYTEINWKNLFLKDLIYTKAYKVVKNLIEKDKENYEKIMAWKIWLFELENNFILPDKNVDTKKYFEFIMNEILLLIKKKNG